MGKRLKSRTYQVKFQNGTRLCGLTDSEAFSLFETHLNSSNPCVIYPEPNTVATTPQHLRHPHRGCLQMAPQGAVTTSPDPLTQKPKQQPYSGFWKPLSAFDWRSLNALFFLSPYSDN